MNRIDQKFKALNRIGEKALVGFVTAGDPDPERSMAIIEGMCRAGLDVLELGIPFSDPTADGPVIQRSSCRALQNGVTLKTVLGMVKRIRAFTDIPIILFTYYNPVHAFGAAAFYREALAAGADGLLIVDLPPEESEELTRFAPEPGMPLIRLIAPTTPEERMERIARSAEGFIYMVSKTGVTGSDGFAAAEIQGYVDSLRRFTGLPLCVGFGISTREDVAGVAACADGVVIGSAFERLIEENLDNPELAAVLERRTAAYKEATRTGRRGG